MGSSMPGILFRSSMSPPTISNWTCSSETLQLVKGVISMSREAIIDEIEGAVFGLEYRTRALTAAYILIV